MLDRRKKIVFSLILLAVTSVFFLVAAEVLLRLVPNSITALNEEPYKREKHEKIGWRLQPNQSVDWLEFTKGIRINSLGMRDVERKIKGSSRRCLLLGDSFLRAFEVNLEDTFYARLEKASGIEMLNFGESGYGTTQSYATYEHFAKQFSGDCVVYFFYLNDFADNNRNLRGFLASGGQPGSPPWPYAPSFEPTKDGDQLVFTPPETFFTEDGSKETGFKKIKTYLFKKFHVVRFYRHYKELALAPLRKPAPLTATKSAGQPPAASLPQSYAVNRECCAEDVDLAFRQLRTSLSELKASVKRDGRELFVVFLPSYMEYLSPAERKEFLKTMDFEEGLYQEIKSALATYTKEEQIPFLDPTDFFTAYKKEKALKPPYFRPVNNGHYSEAGHAALAEYLLKNFVPRLKFGKAAAPTGTARN